MRTSYSNGHHRKYCYEEYYYTFNGATYISQRRCTNPTYKEGDIVKIKVNPNYPQEIEDKTNISYGIWGLLGGCCMLAVGSIGRSKY